MTIVSYAIYGESMQQKIKINKEMDNRKIKYILSGTLKLSGNNIKKLKQAEGIILNGESVHVDRAVKEGDELVLLFPSEQSQNIVPEEICLDILYEDEDLIAVNKPPMMPTHPSKEHYSGTLANGVMHYFKGKFTFRVITRLDRETSGVVIIAKNSLAAQRLNDDMKQRKINKEYAAVVNGTPMPHEGIINAPIKRSDGMRRCVAPDGKETITNYSVEKTAGGLSFVKLTPITGRTHQLRVHMHHIGTPIYGDDMYFAPQTGERVRLHCAKVELCQPITGERLVIKAPAPCDITELVE